MRYELECKMTDYLRSSTSGCPADPASACRERASHMIPSYPSANVETSPPSLGTRGAPPHVNRHRETNEQVHNFFLSPPVWSRFIFLGPTQHGWCCLHGHEA